MHSSEKDVLRDAVQGAACVEDTGHGLAFHRLPAWTRDQYGQDLSMGTAAAQ